MSLTSFLKSPGIEAQFAAFFPFRETRFNWPVLAPRLSANPQLIGTAFDYVVRFHLQKWSAPQRFDDAWVAANGLSLLRGSPLYPNAKKRFQIARERFRRFQEGAPCDDDLLASTLHLAQLDWVFREAKRGAAFSFEEAVADLDLEDLRGCTALLSPALFKLEEAAQSGFPLLLNPTFGPASGLVGGADADFCAEHTLFEIKTVRDAIITPRMHYQLLGYCALHELGAIGNSKEEPRRELREVAVYFSRHGKIARFRVQQLIESAAFDEFLHWLAPRAAKQFDTHIFLTDLRRLNIKPSLSC